MASERLIPYRTAWVVKSGSEFLGPRGYYRSPKTVPFEKARLFHRKSDAVQADQPKGSNVMAVAVIPFVDFSYLVEPVEKT